MKNKKIILELVVYYLLALIPLIILSNWAAARLGNDYWVSSESYEVSLSGFVGMWFPTIAALITRFLFGQKMKDHYLGFELKSGLKMIGLSLLMVSLSDCVVAFFFWLTYLHGDTSIFDPAEIKTMPIWLMYAMIFSVYMFQHAFGEEWGWRGYMMPKLLSITKNKNIAIIVGGILWGLWHAPLTIYGHNFGVDYKFFPWAGIAFMCAFCTVENYFLTAITEYSKSIYPSAICHAFINIISFGGLLSLMMNEEQLESINELLNKSTTNFTPHLYMMIGWIFTLAFGYLVWKRVIQQKKEKI